MSRDELVESYLEGRISRRKFVRGLIATGVSLSAALAYAEALRAQGPGAVRIGQAEHPVHHHHKHTTDVPDQQGIASRPTRSGLFGRLRGR